MKARCCAGLLLLATALPAQAEDCAPLDEQSFRDLLLQLQAGIDRGDLDLSKEVLSSLRARIPCLTFAPEPRRWADVLVGESIVRFAEGEDWEPTMTTALRIYPAVDRGVSSRHPLASFEPPQSTAPLQIDTVDESRIYVDGLPVKQLPPDGEVHLVQRTDGRFWNSFRTDVDTQLPTEWADDDVDQPARVISWGAVGLGLGIASVDQETVGSFTSDWTRNIASGTRSAPALAAHAQGQATFFSPFGVYARATAWTWPDSPGIDGHIAGIGQWKALTLGAGFGTGSVEVFQGPETPVQVDDETNLEETRETFLPRYALGMAHLRGGSDTRWHVGLLLGGWGGARRMVLEAHIAPSANGAGRWRVGATLESVRGRVEEQGRSTASVDAGSIRSGLHISRVFGEY